MFDSGRTPTVSPRAPTSGRLPPGRSLQRHTIARLLPTQVAPRHAEVTRKLMHLRAEDDVCPRCVDAPSGLRLGDLSRDGLSGRGRVNRTRDYNQGEP